MRLYRLCKEKYATLDGYGAFLFGGRWNSPGKAVVYTAENRALAALEFLVGVEHHHRPLGKLVMLTLEVPEDIKHESLVQVVDRHDLPVEWRHFPAPQSLAKLGDRWLQNNGTCLLQVPSVHVPEEFNYLLNPRHADFNHIKVLEQKVFYFDERLKHQ